MNEYEIMFCLASIVKAYDEMPGTEDEFTDAIEKARSLVDLYARKNAVAAGRLDPPVTHGE